MARKKKLVPTVISYCRMIQRLAEVSLAGALRIRKEHPRVVHLSRHAKKHRTRKKNRARLNRIARKYLKGVSYDKN